VLSLNWFALYNFFCSTVLIEFGLFCTLTGEDLLSNFGDEPQGEIMVVDFLVHCLRHDDIVHKVDSVGYRVFLTTTFFVSYFDTLVFVHPYNILYFFWQNDALWSLKLFFHSFFQFAVSECPRILNDDSSETAEFIKVWRTLESQLQHYDLSKAKLVSSLLHTLLFLFNTLAIQHHCQ